MNIKSNYKYLLSDLTALKGVGVKTTNLLKKKNINSLFDLLWKLPKTFTDRTLSSKLIDLNEDSIGKKYTENFINATKFIDMNDLLTKLSIADLQYTYFEKSILIDNIWREFIFNKFKS